MSAKAIERITGRVKWFDQKKGFGFLTRDDGGEDLFVHYSDIEGKGFRELREGQTVTFGVGEGKKGPKAVAVTVEG
jgi:CspA family cold shock protein